MTSLDFSSVRRATVRIAPAFVLLAAAPARAADGGLQLLPDFFGTLPVLLVVFVVLTLILKPLIFQPLLKVMDDREEQIDGARRRADQVEEQASEALGRYEESIRGAHDEAAAQRRVQIDAAREELARISQEAKEEASREIDRAREEIGGSVETARATLREGANELATLAAERILGRSL